MEGIEETGNGHDKSLVTAEEILGSEDLATKTFEFRGKFYRIRELSGDQGDRLGQIGQDKTDKRNKMALLAQMSLIDEGGNQLFAAVDLPKLARRPFAWLGRVQKEVLELSGLTPEAQTKLGEGSAPTEDGSSRSA